MKNKKQYNLEESIKYFHKTEPLKIDLSKSVADRIFGKSKEVADKFDKWLYVFITILIAAGLIYSTTLLKDFPLPLMCVIILLLSGYLVLSFKEISIVSKRLLSY